MKLSLSQIRQITTGAVRIEEVEDAIHFFRFTREQEELYKNRSDSFYMKTFATSGVQMRFRTDSRSIFLNVDTEMGSTRRYFSLEVFVNGERIGAIKNFSEEALFGDFTKWEFPLGNFSGQFDLGEGEKEVRIYFPWSVKVALKAFVLDEGSFVIPVKPSKQLLCFGDSISHGYDVLFPSNKYLTKLADLLDAEEHNKAIGGEIYFRLSFVNLTERGSACTVLDFQQEYNANLTLLKGMLRLHCLLYLSTNFQGNIHSPYRLGATASPQTETHPAGRNQNPKSPKCYPAPRPVPG